MNAANGGRFGGERPMIDRLSPAAGRAARGAALGAAAFGVMCVTVGMFLPVWLGVPAFAAAGAAAAWAGLRGGGPLLSGGLLFVTLDLPGGQWFYWGVGVVLGLVVGARTGANGGAGPAG